MRIPNKKRIKEYLESIARGRRKKLRDIDVEMVWTALRDTAPDIETARNLFISHAMRDEIWTADMTDAEIVDFINALE